MSKKAYEARFTARSPRPVEKNTDVPPGTVRHLKKAKSGTESHAHEDRRKASTPVPFTDAPPPPVSEVTWLLQEIKRGTTDREILEEALAFFARDED